MTDADAQKLIKIVDFFIYQVEHLAFDMKPPNEYTPRFVQLCVETRAIVARFK